jgi:hypothetical protein
MEQPVKENAHMAEQLRNTGFVHVQGPQIQQGSKESCKQPSVKIQCIFAGLCGVLPFVLEPVVRYLPVAVLSYTLNTATWALTAITWQLLKVTFYAVLLLLLMGCVWISYRLCKFVYNILVFKAPNLDLSHDCITPEPFNHKRPLQSSTNDFFDHLYQGLTDLSDEGSVLYMKPLQLAEDILIRGLESATADLWDLDQCSALQDAMTKPLAQLLERQEISMCMQHCPPPGGVVLVGTAHVSRKSADDTKRVILVSSIGFEVWVPQLLLRVGGPYQEDGPID